MPRKTLVLILVLILIAGSLLWLALSQTKFNKPSAPSTTKTQASIKQTTLALSPNPVIVSSAGSVAVMIDAGPGNNNRVTAVQLEISYDPKVLTNVNISPSSPNGFFQNPVELLKEIDSAKGKISYAVGIAPNGVAKSGTGPVATITFLVAGQKGTTRSMYFLPGTLVTAEGISSSVLQSNTGTVIQIQ